MYAGRDAKQAIEFAWHKTIACNIPKVGQPWITNLRIMWTAKWAKTRHGFSCSPLGQGAMSTYLFPVIAQMESSYTYSC